jgi:uncharacterized protein YcaQ
MAHIRKLAAKLHLFQIDSVNVLARAHYVPAFARLGPYRMETLDELAYRKRELFEYWGHAACLIPLSLYPLMRFRMYPDDALEYMRLKRYAYLASVYAEVAERGPITAAELSDPGKRSSKWWGWGRGKASIEYLFDSGLLAIAGRRRFERLYDLAERVIPPAARDLPPPPREEAMKQLICLGARAYGVGTFGDIVGYFMTGGWHDRLSTVPWSELEKGAKRAKPIAKRLVAELVEEGRLLPAQVEGWAEPAYVEPGVRVPRKRRRAGARHAVRLARVGAQAHRAALRHAVHDRDLHARAETRLRLLRVPVSPRRHARRPLRPQGRSAAQRSLMVQSAFLEPGQTARGVVPGLAEALREMTQWLELDAIEVADRGDIAKELRRSVT